MSIKIFSANKALEWREIKSMVKLFFRRLAYSKVSKKIITLVLYHYLFLVYKTSKAKYIGFENIDKLIKNNEPIIFTFWHNRLMMIPFVARKIKRKYNKHNLMTLASKHGDGQLVGNVMEHFGLISILGSTKDGRGVKKGIDYSSLRKIIDGLKKGYALGITPDGPRGPNQQINGELLNIAKITGSKLVPISYSCSKFKIIKKSWDNFKVPLPFSNLCFCIDDEFFEIPRDINQSSLEKIHIDLQLRMDHVQKVADEKVIL